MRSSRISLIVAFVLIVAIAALATGCSRSKATSSGGLTPADKTSSGATASANASDAAAVKNSDGTAAPTTNGNATTGGSGSTNANGSSGTGTGSTATKPGTAAKPGTGAKPVSGMKVRVLFWNDTNSKPLKGTEILVGSSAYKPNTTGKTDRLTTASLAYGKVLQLTVYPDGRGGKKIIVPMMVTGDMAPNSDQDAIHIAISDGSVRILGNPINEVDKTIARF